MDLVAVRLPTGTGGIANILINFVSHHIVIVIYGCLNLAMLPAKYADIIYLETVLDSPRDCSHNPILTLTPARGRQRSTAYNQSATCWVFSWCSRARGTANLRYLWPCNHIVYPVRKSDSEPVSDRCTLWLPSAANSWGIWERHDKDNGHIRRRPPTDYILLWIVLTDE
jgi:hypothetical protein